MALPTFYNSGHPNYTVKWTRNDEWVNTSATTMTVNVYPQSTPKEPTALEWLDKQVDAVCAIARAA